MRTYFSLFAQKLLSLPTQEIINACTLCPASVLCQRADSPHKLGGGFEMKSFVVKSEAYNAAPLKAQFAAHIGWNTQSTRLTNVRARHFRWHGLTS
jgi:hypothetical protein